jgi:CRP/FNR family transcriptional regulator, cyclic AMP receptor protein
MPALASAFEYDELISRCRLFTGLAPHQLARIAALFSERAAPPGTVIVREGDPANELFVVHQGSVEVVRQSASGREQRIATLHEGSLIGEMTLLDRAPRSATVRALTPAVLGVVSMERLQALALSDAGIERAMLRNLANQLSERVRTTTGTTVAALEQQLELEHTRAIMGRFIIFMCFVMVSYTFALQITMKLLPPGVTSSLVTFPLTVLWSGAVWLLMRRSGLPPAFFGVTTRGWWSSMPQTLVWTLAGCAGATLLKLVLIETHGAFANERLFNLSGLLDQSAGSAELQVALILAAVYAVTAPLQEFIVRAGLQTPLHRCLVGRAPSTQSILLSNAIFAAAHVHLSLSFALVAFFVGLLWGDLFARQRQLVGVSLCHLLVGWFAFLVVGFEPWY